MKKPIKDILKEAGRYEDILNILNNIINADNECGSYPVSAYVMEGKISFGVDAKLVKKEATELLKYIVDGEDGAIIESCVSVYNLYNYVQSESNIQLHNYAVHLSHNVAPQVSMDTIRNWEILDNLIACLGSEDQWHIPDGWKAT